MTFFLLVKEASTEISGSSQRYIKAGSEIQLSCTTKVPSPLPGLLYWYRDADLLQNNDRINISTSFASVVSSHLAIKNAREGDSGNYTCWPTKFKPSSVTIHIIRDEEPAAMSHGTLSNGATNGGGNRIEPSKSPSSSSPSGDLATSSAAARRERSFPSGDFMFQIFLSGILTSLYIDASKER